MIAAPLQNSYIDMLHDAGADELGMNLEFWSDAAWKELIPGKEAEIGKLRYLKALEYSVKRFGPINTRTIFVAGLESMDETIDGAISVASMGVMPIISPFRPLNGTMLEDRRGFSATEYWKMYETIASEVAMLDIPLGPTCIYCQNNVLAAPSGAAYKYY